MGTKVAQQVQAQIDRIDRAGMMAQPVRLDLVEQASRAMSFRELDLSMDAFLARRRRAGVR